MGGYLLKQFCCVIRICICLFISILSFNSYGESAENDQNRRCFEDYFLFLLSEDPLIFFRYLHLGIFLKNKKVEGDKSTIWRSTSGGGSAYMEKVAGCALEHSSEYYKWLYLFATDGEGVFECVISALWPKNFAERREPPDGLL